MLRRQVLAAMAAGVATGSKAMAQGAYPNRPIKLICPLAAGGGGDIAARAVGDFIAQKLGQPVVVDNKVGAGSQIGIDAAVKSAPDGYTLLLLPGDIVAIDKAFEASVPYDVKRDLVFISGVASIPLVLVGSTSLNARSLAELVKKAKAAPQSLTFGSLGSSSPHFLFFEWFKHRAGIELADVPYKSTAQATTDLIGSRIDLTMLGEVNAANQARTGRLLPIATTADRRGKLLPEVATFAESFPGLVMNNWYALVAPRGTPQHVVDALHQATAEALRQDSVAARMATIGLSPWTRSPGELSAVFDSDVAHYAEVIRDSGATHEGR